LKYLSIPNPTPSCTSCASSSNSCIGEAFGFKVNLQGGGRAICKQHHALTQPVWASCDLQRRVLRVPVRPDICHGYMDMLPGLTVDVALGCSPTQGWNEDMEEDVDSRRREGPEEDDTCCSWEGAKRGSFFQGNVVNTERTTVNLVLIALKVCSSHEHRSKGCS
jgi:hypothetical protein